MKPNEPLLGFVFALFLLVLWLGFLFHQDDRFAGTLAGGILAVSGSLLLLIPFIYSVVKRVPSLKRSFTKVISFSTFLTIHIYAGFVGAILVLLHTGHKFQGVLATTLTALLLIVVFSGYIGRYLLTRNSKELSEKKQLLIALQSQYARVLAEIQARPEQKQVAGLFAGFFSRLFASQLLENVGSQSLSRAKDILRLSESIADVEYAISSHDLFKKLFSRWLKLHIVLSLLFYALLTLHIGGEYYFGLRWFE